MELGLGPRIFRSDTYGAFAASEIRLNDTLADCWLIRFQLVTVGKVASRWPTINALYVDGIFDPTGDWIAPFPEPTADEPTKF